MKKVLKSASALVIGTTAVLPTTAITTFANDNNNVVSVKENKETDLINKIEDSKKEESTKLQEMNVAKEASDKASEESKKATNEYNTLASQLLAIRDKADKLISSLLTNNSKDKENLEKTIEEITVSKKNLEKMLEEKRVELEELKEAIKKAENDLLQAKEDAKPATAEAIAQAIKKYEDAQKAYDEAFNTLKPLAEQFEAAKDDVLEKQTALDEAKKNYEDAKLVAEAAKQAIEPSKVVLDEKKALLDVALNNPNKAKAEEDYNVASEALHQARVEKFDAKADLENAQDRLQLAQTELNQVRLPLTRITKQVEEAKTALDASVQVTTEAKTLLDTKTTALNELLTQQTEANNAFELAKEKRIKAKADYDVAFNEAVKARDDVKKAQKLYDELLAAAGNDETAPEVVAAKQRVDELTIIRDEKNRVENELHRIRSQATMDYAKKEYALELVTKDVDAARAELAPIEADYNAKKADEDAKRTTYNQKSEEKQRIETEVNAKETQLSATIELEKGNVEKARQVLTEKAEHVEVVYADYSAKKAIYDEIVKAEEDAQTAYDTALFVYTQKVEDYNAKKANEDTYLQEVRNREADLNGSNSFLTTTKQFYDVAKQEADAKMEVLNVATQEKDFLQGLISNVERLESHLEQLFKNQTDTTVFISNAEKDIFDKTLALEVANKDLLQNREDFNVLSNKEKQWLEIKNGNTNTNPSVRLLSLTNAFNEFDSFVSRYQELRIEVTKAKEVMDKYKTIADEKNEVYQNAKKVYESAKAETVKLENELKVYLDSLKGDHVIIQGVDGNKENANNNNSNGNKVPSGDSTNLMVYVAGTILTGALALAFLKQSKKVNE